MKFLACDSQVGVDLGRERKRNTLRKTPSRASRWPKSHLKIKPQKEREKRNLKEILARRDDKSCVFRHTKANK